VTLSEPQSACHHIKGRLASHISDKDQLKEMLSRYPQCDEHDVSGENKNINILLLLLIHSGLAGFQRDLWVNDKLFLFTILLKSSNLYSMY